MRKVQVGSWGKVPLLDTYAARGAGNWEATQIYAPYLLNTDGMIYDFYNANSGVSEQIGLATLSLADWPGLDPTRNPVSRWRRDPTNPIVANGPSCVHQAADPKVSV